MIDLGIEKADSVGLPHYKQQWEADEIAQIAPTEFLSETCSCYNARWPVCSE